MGILQKLFGRDKVLPTSVNDTNFRTEVLDHDGPLLLDVWGPGCAPCVRLAPVMSALATQFQGRVKVCELNAAEAPRAASKLKVRGTPTTIVYRNRAEIGRIVGWKPRSFFAQMIEAEFPVEAGQGPDSP